MVSITSRSRVRSGWHVGRPTPKTRPGPNLPFKMLTPSATPYRPKNPIAFWDPLHLPDGHPQQHQHPGPVTPQIHPLEDKPPRQHSPPAQPQHLPKFHHLGLHDRVHLDQPEHLLREGEEDVGDGGEGDIWGGCQ